jgi:bla regulator protein BlaR1
LEIGQFYCTAAKGEYCTGGNHLKKFIYISILVIILSLLLISCSNIKHNTIVTSNHSAEKKENTTDIIIQSPMTVSNNSLFPINGQHQYLRLKMVKGKYYEDWKPGALMGTIWEGYYVIELTDDLGNTIAQTDLSKIYKEPLIFNSNFQIQFDDYNNDGDLDFTIGQYGSSNGSNYKVFTLRKDGKIEELPIKGYPSLFISDTTGYYSTKLTKVDKITFKKEHYDNSKQKRFEDIFRWDGKEFFQVESHEVNRN